VVRNNEQNITICAKCQHSFNKKDGPRTQQWYNWFCKHPHVERQLGIDPVTGEKCYTLKNDLDKIVTTREKHPNCRGVNFGYCEMYEC